MAQTLRHALGRGTRPADARARLTLTLACLPVALILVPLLPGLYWALQPVWDKVVWEALWADRQFLQATMTTLLCAVSSTALAALWAGAVATLVYPGKIWQRLHRQLAPLLAVPHAAFAVGLFFLLSPSGWLARWLAWPLGWASPPDWVTVQDPYALGLSVALAVKECWFLLWVLAAVLGETTVARHMRVARSLGYSPLQAWRHVLWPLVLPRLAWPLAAVFAYSLSVVDMAVILGPSNPPTLAVLAWHWLSDPQPALQARGSAASLVLLGLLLVFGGGIRWFWVRIARYPAYPSGLRRSPSRWQGVRVHPPLLLVGYAALAVLLLWSLADAWFFPAIWPDAITLEAWQQADWAPFWTTLWLASVVNLLSLAITLVWLEWGPKRWNAVLYLPLILPSLPLVACQYAALLHLGLDGTALGLVWSHLLWVFPYVLLTLAGVYRKVDPRLLTTARAMGCSQVRACLRVKWPTLMRPILAALAVGFAVSVAQYLPTLFAGGGRFVTVTTEAVALSSGGNRRTLAMQAWLQVALPLTAFAVAAWLPAWAARHRKGLR